MPKPFLNPEREAYMRENYLLKSSTEIALVLNVNRSTIQKYLKILGLIVPKSVVNEFRARSHRGRTSFTKEMDAFLLNNYLTMPMKALGREINRSYTGVSIRLKQLNLVIPKHIIEQRKNESRFKKGLVPVNKGKKLDEFMSPETKAKFLKNSFKKGQLPHNTTYNGYERVSKDGYTEVRISKGVFVLKHRMVYEKMIGPIPEGFVVVFVDGNKKNFNKSNLKAISKKQHMLNNTIHHYPKELKQSIILINKLNKQL